MNTEKALITGATSGIGLHLAREFASHGHPLVLVAPVGGELHDVAGQIQREFGVEVMAIAADLREPAAPERLYQQVGETIDILVNNAGHGQKGAFWDYPMDEDISMLRLNVEAVVRMTKVFVAHMVRRGHGRVLNVASVAGFVPGPGMATYHATKAFVLSLSESLATELEDTAVTLTALCPGPTDTDFFIKADALASGNVNKAPVMAPQDVAREGYDGLMSGDRVVVPGAANKAMVFSRRVLPESVQAKWQEQMVADVPPDQQKYHRGEKEAEAAARDAR